MNEGGNQTSGSRMNTAWHVIEIRMQETASLYWWKEVRMFWTGSPI